MEAKPVIIFGANSLGKAALEIFTSNGIVVYGFVDDKEDLHGQEIGDVVVLGKTDDHGFLKLIGQKCDAFVAIEDSSERKSAIEMLIENRKVMPVNAIHKNSTVSDYAQMGYGNFINEGARFGAFSKIGNHCTLNSNCVVEHEAELGDLVQVGAGAILNSGVNVGDSAFIGSGAIVVGGVKIGANARIGAGSVVIADVGENETVFGNPAEKVK